VSPSIGALQYEFEIGSAGRGLEYEDHPSGYAYPPPLTSDWLSAPVWPITNETFGDIYGGHAKKVTLKLRDAHGEIGTWTFDRDFFVLGDILRLQLFEDYLLSKINVGGLDPSIIPAAKAVARAETGGALQQFHPIAGSIATRNGYPAVDPRHGYGIYQLTAGPPSRGQIWNWKENTDEGIKRINTLLGNVRNRFQSCNYLYTEAQLRLEAYAEYNSGWYFATSNGLNPNLSSQPPCPFVSPLAPDSSWACGVCGPLVDGQYSMRWGQSATGVCAPISQCYARVAQGFETP
jgi:hypothetical protein